MYTRLCSAQSVSRCSVSCNSRATGGSSYSTLGGTVGCTVRVTRPSRSRLRRVRVSMRRLMPSMLRSNSVKRMGPWAAATRICTLHLPETLSRTSRTGHACAFTCYKDHDHHREALGAPDDRKFRHVSHARTPRPRAYGGGV